MRPTEQGVCVYASSDPFDNGYAPELLGGVWTAGEEDPDSVPEVTAESTTATAWSTSSTLLKAAVDSSNDSRWVCPEPIVSTVVAI